MPNNDDDKDHDYCHNQHDFNIADVNHGISYSKSTNNSNCDDI